MGTLPNLVLCLLFTHWCSYYGRMTSKLLSHQQWSWKTRPSWVQDWSPMPPPDCLVRSNWRRDIMNKRSILWGNTTVPAHSVSVCYIMFIVNIFSISIPLASRTFGPARFGAQCIGLISLEASSIASRPTQVQAWCSSLIDWSFNPTFTSSTWYPSNGFLSPFLVQVAIFPIFVAGFSFV